MHIGMSDQWRSILLLREMIWDFMRLCDVQSKKMAASCSAGAARVCGYLYNPVF